MSARALVVRLVVLSIVVTVSPVVAQGPPPPADPQPHVHPTAEAPMLFAPRDASGTAWLPDHSLMYGVPQSAGSWQVMWHGNAFLQYLRESGARGSDQTGSINWVMAMARRNLGGGRLGLRGMASLEPWTIRGCGYPDLLATGEVCDGETIHDRQHPHDLFMEIAADYDRPLAGAVRWQIYGGVAGEPALGPVAYPHRLSSMPNPLAPIGHHWLDATHITFGVVTAGVYGPRWKVEGSSFNGREPDEKRRGFDFGALDSFSARLSLLPTSALAFQVSAGRLTEAEPGHAAGPRVDVTRVSASATYHRTLGSDGTWATTVAWGRNQEEGESSNAFLAETSALLRERHAWFARAEAGTKAAHDLDVHGAGNLFTLGKLQGGYTRYVSAWRGLKPGLGISVSAAVVPRGLTPAYGGRVNAGVGVFLTLRPAVHTM